MEIIDCIQGTDTWFELRAMRMTMSHADAIGNCGTGLTSYIVKKVAEKYSTAERDNYTNEAMERGTLLESEAGALYAWEYNHVIEKVGFVIYSDFVGASPDLFVDVKGSAEIKCRNDAIFTKLMWDGKIPSKDKWQMQGVMLVCKKDWCDYIVYNPNFERNLFVERIFPDKKKFAKLEEGFKIGEKLIKEITKEIEG